MTKFHTTHVFRVNTLRKLCQKKTQTNNKLTMLFKYLFNLFVQFDIMLKVNKLLLIQSLMVFFKK